jgi:cytochrome c553
MSPGTSLFFAVMTFIAGGKEYASGAQFTASPTSAVAPLPAKPARPTTPEINTLLKWDSETKALTVPGGTPEAHFTFNLTNISSGDVTIDNVYTSCGCTVAKLPEQPWKLAPGANGQIHVTMNLAGKIGTVVKTITIITDKGTKQVFVKTTIRRQAAQKQMSTAARTRNQRIALADRQAVFKGACARCHAEPARYKMGEALYQSVCGVCHEAEHRATMVPDLHAIPQASNAQFWRTWITKGKPGTLMPAFSKTEGGILSELQISSLVNYLAATIPSRPASPATAQTALPK